MRSGEALQTTDTGQQFADIAADAWETAEHDRLVAYANGLAREYGFAGLGDFRQRTEWGQTPPPVSPAVGHIPPYTYTASVQPEGGRFDTSLYQPLPPAPERLGQQNVHINPHTRRPLPTPVSHRAAEPDNTAPASYSHPAHQATQPTIISRAPVPRVPEPFVNQRSIRPEVIRGAATPTAITYPIGELAASLVVVPGKEGVRRTEPTRPAQPVVPGRAGAAKAAGVFTTPPTRPPQGSHTDTPRHAQARHAKTPDAFADYLQQGAAVYANKMHDLNPDNVEQPGVAPEAPLHGYDFIDDWAQQLDHKKPGGYVSHTEEIPAPRIAARPVTPEKPVTRGSKSYPEAPDLQRPVDHTNIDDSRVGIVAPSQDMLSQKLDRRYRSQHRNTSERRTLSFVRRVTGQLLGYAATAGYAVAANETYLHHIPFLQVH